MSKWFSVNGECILLALHVQPGAKRTSVAGLHGDALKIRLAAPPIEGRANEALMRFLADFFEVPLRNVVLKQGGQSRQKRVEICGSAIPPQNLLQLPESS